MVKIKIVRKDKKKWVKGFLSSQDIARNIKLIIDSSGKNDITYMKFVKDLQKVILKHYSMIDTYRSNTNSIYGKHSHFHRLLDGNILVKKKRGNNKCISIDTLKKS